MNKNVVVLAEAASDIERGIDFYDAIEDGVGLYFETHGSVCGSCRLYVFPNPPTLRL